MNRALLSLLLVSCVALATLPLSSAIAASDGAAMSETYAPVSSADPVDAVNSQLAAVPAVTSTCDVDSVLTWLDRVGGIFTRIAAGGLPSLPPSAVDAVQTLGSQITSNAKRMGDTRVVAKVVELLPAMWTMGFFYAKIETWKPVLSAVVTPTVTACKTSSSSYAGLVNATSLIIRFTKDNVFMDGVDPGGAIPNAANKAYVAWLAPLVASVSTVEGFTLTEAQLRAYMNTLPSKKDGMDMSVAFPVYVNTTKYKASDAAALRAFLAKLPAATPTQSTQ